MHAQREREAHCTLSSRGFGDDKCSSTRGHVTDKEVLAKLLGDLTDVRGKYCFMPESAAEDLPLANNNDNDRIQRCNLRFFTLSSLRRKLSPICTLKWPWRNCMQITCNTLSAYHVQHVPPCMKGHLSY